MMRSGMGRITSGITRRDSEGGVQRDWCRDGWREWRTDQVRWSVG